MKEKIFWIYICFEGLQFVQMKWTVFGDFGFLYHQVVNLTVDCVEWEVKFQFFLSEANFWPSQVKKYDEIYEEDSAEEIGGRNRRWKLFVQASVPFLPKKTMKNGGKKSFLAIPNQKLHTGSLDAVDQRRARLVSIWWTKMCAK